MTVSPREKRVYRALFLTIEDVPDLEAREAVHTAEAEPGDDAWRSCRGIRARFQVWQRVQGTDLARLVDARWLFPSETDARGYHASRMAANAEGFIPAPGFRMSGGDVAAFSGRDPFGLGAEMRIYLFVLGRVCAKVFLTGIEEAPGVGLLHRAESRIEEALLPGL